MKFGEKYFKGGAESNYTNYTSRRYTGLAKDINKILKIQPRDCILDYGCATGALVKQLNKFCETEGTDISDWAINYGRKRFRLYNRLFYYDKIMLENYYDYVLFLDVLEHMSNKQLNETFKRLDKNKQLKKIIVRIPIAAIEKQDFVLDVSRKDKTHIQIHSKNWWNEWFLRHGYEVCGIIKEKNIYDSDGVLAWLLQRKE